MAPRFGEMVVHRNDVVQSALMVLYGITVMDGVSVQNVDAYERMREAVMALDPTFPMGRWLATARRLRANRIDLGQV